MSAKHLSNWWCCCCLLLFNTRKSFYTLIICNFHNGITYILYTPSASYKCIEFNFELHLPSLFCGFFTINFIEMMNNFWDTIEYWCIVQSLPFRIDCIQCFSIILFCCTENCTFRTYEIIVCGKKTKTVYAADSCLLFVSFDAEAPFVLPFGRSVIYCIIEWCVYD